MVPNVVTYWPKHREDFFKNRIPPAKLYTSRTVVKIEKAEGPQTDAEEEKKGGPE